MAEIARKESTRAGLHLSRNVILGVVVFAGFGIAMPLWAGAIWIKVVTSAAAFSLAAAGAALLYNRLGMVSLVQVALVGVGGWVMLRLDYATPLPFEALLITSGLVTALVGVLLSLPALKMRGLYLALVTLMAAGAFQILFSAYQFPNGGEGFLGVAMQSGGEMRRPAIAKSDAAYLSYSVVVVTLGFLLVALHERTRPGRAWSMIRKSEANAMAAGVDVTRYKLWAFALSGFLAGIGGAVLAGSLGLLDSKTFPAGESILLFALTVVGGVTHWLGAILAAALFRVLPALLNDMGVDADIALIIFGAALIHAIMTAPRGIAGQLLRLLGMQRRSKARSR